MGQGLEEERRGPGVVESGQYAPAACNRRDRGDVDHIECLRAGGLHIDEPGVAAAQPGNLRSDIGPELFHIDPETRSDARRVGKEWGRSGRCRVSSVTY